MTHVLIQYLLSSKYFLIFIVISSRRMNYLDVYFLISKHTEFIQPPFYQYFQLNVIDIREKSLLSLLEICLVVLSSLQSVFVNVLCRLDKTNVYPAVLWFSVLCCIYVVFIKLAYYFIQIFYTLLIICLIYKFLGTYKLHPQHIQNRNSQNKGNKYVCKNLPLF